MCQVAATQIDLTNRDKAYVVHMCGLQAGFDPEAQKRSPGLGLSCLSPFFSSHSSVMAGRLTLRPQELQAHVTAL